MMHASIKTVYILLRYVCQFYIENIDNIVMISTRVMTVECNQLVWNEYHNVLYVVSDFKVSFI